jgi:hypothetical protein
MSRCRRGTSVLFALCASALVAWSAAAADGQKIRVVDSVTGFAVHADVDRGVGPLVVKADGYAPLSIPAPAEQELNVVLRPLLEPPQTTPAEIERHRRPGTTLVQGFVSDEGGQPLADVRVTVSGSDDVTTDGGGFFRTWLRVQPAIAGTPMEHGELTVSHPGFVEQHRTGIELWDGGDWTYQLHLTPGSGEATIDEGLLRHRRGDDADAAPSQHGPKVSANAFTPQLLAAAPVVPTLPSGIRVPNAAGGVDYLDLDTYTKRVLPAEWYASWSTLAGGLGMNALKAGAVAIRTYAIGYVKQPYASTYDICATPACQMYDPSAVTTATNQAVDQTTGVVMVDASFGITQALTEYCDEANNAGSWGDGYTADGVHDAVCAGTASNGHGHGMCQHGSARWASGLNLTTLLPHGYGTLSWQQILAHYYPSLQLATGQVLKTGDRVRVINAPSGGLKVRLCTGGGIEQGSNCPTAAAGRLTGASGTLVAGAQQVSADGSNFVWWKVRWDADGATGWSQENYLERISSGAPPRGDFDGDGRSDILWRNAVTGSNALWLANGATHVNVATAALDPANAPAAIGDFDGDGRADIVWRNGNSGANALWLMNGAAATALSLNAVTDRNWQVVAAGDFDGDGKADLFWRNGVTGANAIWLMNGGLSTNVAVTSIVDTNWRVVACGDFNADGKLDLFWRNGVTGANAVWLMNGAVTTNYAVNSIADLTWSVAGSGDFDGNGTGDILWRQSGGGTALWLMNGVTATNVPMLSMTSAWSPRVVGDFNGDGRSDVAWRNGTTGENAVWLLNGGTIVANTPEALVDVGWSSYGPR